MQQQQQQLQFSLDMKGIMALLEDNNTIKVPYISQVRQDMVNMYPNTIEEQGYLYSMLNLNGNASAPEASTEETLWEGLWNLDDVHANFSIANATSKASLQNLVAPFC